MPTTHLIPSAEQPPTAPDGYCPVTGLIGVIGGRWKPHILWHLLDTPSRTGELARAVPGITQKVLTQHLRELERDGIITRTVYPEVPPHVEYRVTTLGATLRGVLKAMCTWSRDHLGAVDEARALYNARPAPRLPAPHPAT